MECRIIIKKDGCFLSCEEPLIDGLFLGFDEETANKSIKFLNRARADLDLPVLEITDTTIVATVAIVNQNLLDLAKQAVASQEARRNENVEEWADRLAGDVAAAND